MSTNDNNSIAVTYTNGGSWMYRNGTDEHENASYHPHNQPNWHTSNIPFPLFHHHHSSLMFDDQGSNGPWRLFEERVRTGPFGLSRFPSQPYSPIRVLIVSRGNLDDRLNPRLREFITNSPPRIRREWHLNLPIDPEPEDPAGLTNEEFEKAMKKLKKQTYDPYKRSGGRKRGLFGTRSSSSSSNKSSDVALQGEKISKECTICLEEFVLNDQVLVTPCNHMFHNDCLVPWIRGHGKCPVCRFVLCERSHNSLRRNYGNYVPLFGEQEESLALMRAMEEAFNWINESGAIAYR